ncbi:cytochrome P450 [Snodgrassella sp. CFCC 13594]|uniref:cytochrome P450 n=1 Tax=Snodgrassella sp. CFCC 13594 TaxID=1775559 RepID=UPI000830B823|nr:cytochrome P450 [Snodgrassella sp. CFCC 13594]
MILESQNLCHFLYDLIRKHNQQNVWTEVDGERLFIVQNAKDADYVLRVNHKNYHKNMLWFRHTLGQTRLSEDGEAWKNRQQLTQPFFTHFDKEKLALISKKFTGQMINEVINKQGLTLDDSVLRKLSICILTKYYFGITVEELGINIDNLTRLMDYGSEFSIAAPGSANKHSIKSIMADLMELRVQVLQDLAIFRYGHFSDSPILQALIQADSAQTGIILEHELLALFTAGAETTASAIGWACYLLGRYPEIQHVLEEESAHAGHFDGYWEKLDHAVKLESFISESLRLYPPVPVISRCAVQNDRIGDEVIDAGSKIAVSLVGIAYDMQTHKNPWVPNLEEALNNKLDKTQGRYSAFSFGPRVCGGKGFAMVELLSVMDTVCNKVHVETLDSGVPNFHWKSKMLYRGGFPVSFHLR